jgi:membrane protease YdiL (CAAX protease family)
MRPRTVAAHQPSAPLAAAVGTAVLAAVILALLLSRTLVAGSSSAVPVLLMLYVAVGAVSLSAPVADSRETLLPRAAVLVAGTACVAAVWATHPSVVPRAAGLGAVGLNTLAAISEEAFFRRFLYGRLSAWPLVAVVLPALAFAAIHIPVYGAAVFWVDLGAGLLLGWQRWASGSWTVPAATHTVANVLAVIR